MAEQFIFHMYRLNKHYGPTHVLKDVNLSFYPGAKIGIVGENGAGKSTVLRIMAGLDDEFQGEAAIVGDFRAGMVAQEPVLDQSLTVKDTIAGAFGETNARLNEYNDIAAKMAEPMDDDAMQKAIDRMGVLQEWLDATDGWNLDHQIARASDALCLPDDDRTVGTLSGGERRRVALCRALLEKPDLLLLDEPTNHLDAETVEWLEMQLRDYPGTVIIVTHDRYFLDNITKWILELEGGRGIPWEGNYSSWLEQKLTKLAAAAKDGSPRGRALGRELAWIRMSNRDRRELARARVMEYEQLLARETAEEQNDGAAIRIAPGPPLGDQVIAFEGVSKGYDEGPLFEDVSFRVPKGAVVGLVGPNGAGKTTVLRLITGELSPDAGRVTVGETVVPAYVAQERGLDDADRGLVEAIGDGAEEIVMGKQRIAVRKYLAQFGFTGADQQKTVGELSGGERNRCNLAVVMKAGGNVLLLDEPTNDLDVNTLRMLEDAIAAFAGCVLVVSHDRFFLDRICTHLLVFEGEGRVRWCEGNFKDYEDQRRSELGDARFERRRRRYHRLVSH